MTDVTLDQACAILQDGTATIVPADGVRTKLETAQREKRPLIVKLGFDPTAPDLHLGHAVVLRKLRQFQDLGHRIIFIVGEFTGRIGDPTGKNKARPPLTHEQVSANAATYLHQIGKILDTTRLEARSNAEWFDKMTVRDSVELLAGHTLAQLMEREDFSKRFREGTPISLHELMYPILQGYDSFMIHADIEMGGNDQLLNCLVGREIQEARGQAPQVVLCMPLLRGTDGSIKMSKSEGNYVGLTDEPSNMYGKIMSIPDDLLEEYIELAMAVPRAEKQELKRKLADGTENPMVIKKAVAFDVVRQFHGVEPAEAAAEAFARQFQKKALEDEDYERVPIDSLPGRQAVPVVDICAMVAKKSKAEIRRLIQSGAININGDRVNDPMYKLAVVEPGTRIRIGKRGYYEIVN